MFIRTTCLISLLALALPACQNDLSHTRLSTRDASVNISKVNNPSMHQLEAAVITALRERHPAAGMADFYLLKGSSYDSYEKVAQRLDLSTGLVIPEHTIGKVPLYAVRAVNLHGASGSVLTLHPGGTSEVAVAYRTVPGKGDAKEWQVVDVKKVSETTDLNHADSSKWYRRYADGTGGTSNGFATPTWFERNILVGPYWESNDSPERRAKRAARADMIAKHRAAQAEAKAGPAQP